MKKISLMFVALAMLAAVTVFGAHQQNNAEFVGPGPSAVTSSTL